MIIKIDQKSKETFKNILEFLKEKKYDVVELPEFHNDYRIELLNNGILIDGRVEIELRDDSTLEVIGVGGSDITLEFRHEDGIYILKGYIGLLIEWLLNPCLYQYELYRFGDE